MNFGFPTFSKTNKLVNGIAMGKLCAVFFFPPSFTKSPFRTACSQPEHSHALKARPKPKGCDRQRDGRDGRDGRDEAVLETGFNGDFFFSLFFFFFWGGGKVGMEIFGRCGVRPKNGWRKHFEGSFCQSHGAARNGREANGRAPSWSTHIVRCQFGALKHESLLTLIG